MNILKFDSETAWIDGATTFWRDRLRSNLRLRMCLPSGNTPNRIYGAIAWAVAKRAVSFQQAEVFALDDFGGLAADDEGSCPNMLRRYLLNDIDLPPSAFHMIDTTAPDLAAVGRDYDRLIGAGFDLAVLGIGLNGHLGMNEPGSSPQSTTRRVDLHPTTVEGSKRYLKHDRLPTWGVTVGLKHLLGSKEVWLLANGATKAAIIEKTVKGPVTMDVPASLLRNHPNCFLFVDQTAGARI